MTRVLMLAKYSPCHPGGIETAVREFLKFVQRTPSDVEIDVYCFAESNANLKCGPCVTIRDCRTTLTIWSTPFSSSMFRKISRQAQRYDVVHLHLPNPWAATLALMFCRRSRLIVSLHGITTRYPLLQILERLLTAQVLQRANQIVVSAAENVTCYGLEKYGSRIKVIPYGISDSECATSATQGKPSPHTIPQDPFFLFVGRLVYYKGLEYLIRTMCSVPARLVIVGNGPLRGRLMSLIQSLDLSDRVIMAGPVSQDLLANYYARCLAFVLPSITVSESFGLSALEAMSFGKPLVVTRLGTGLETLVKNAENGFIVQPKNIAELALALNTLLANKDRVRAFGLESRKLFLQQYAMEHTNAKLLELYQGSSTSSN